MSSNPAAMFNEFLGVAPDTQHFELWHDVLLQAKRAGANDILLQLSTGVLTNPTDNAYSSTSYNPPQPVLLALAADIRALGMNVTVSFFSHVENVITGSGGLDRPQPTDRQLWMQNHRLRVLEAARLARALNASTMIFMQDETQHLLRDAALTAQWVQLIRDVRAEYSGKITTVWWTNAFSDSISAIPRAIVDELDVLGIGLFPNLTRENEPTLQTLCNAYRSDVNGTNVISYLATLSSQLGKRIWITDKAFHSFKGAGYDEWRIFDSAIPLVADEGMQGRLYESLFGVLRTANPSWLDGISFQNFNVLVDGANPWIARFVDGPLSESPQHKVAEGVMSDWFNGRRATGC